jgi:glycosyltransferase involved in cell wall biosynthesis
MTYQRHHILEEAVYSFLQQNYDDTEMLILNDSPDVRYHYNHPKIRIINHQTRFPSLLEKLEYGFSQSRGKFVYRLDDDDLLAPNGLQLVQGYIESNPGYDVYRCQNHYNFLDNQYYGLGSNINNGNCYDQEYIKRFEFNKSCSFGEDVLLTCNPNARMYNGDTGRYSMIYRWGMKTYHISGWGDITPDQANQNVDNFVRDHCVYASGDVELNPHFLEDYYQKLT